MYQSPGQYCKGFTILPHVVSATPFLILERFQGAHCLHLLFLILLRLSSLSSARSSPPCVNTAEFAPPAFNSILLSAPPRPFGTRPSAAECGESHVLLWKGVSLSFILSTATLWRFHCLASMCNLLTAVMQFPIPFLSLHAELAAEDEEKRQSPEAALGTIYAVSRAKGG